MAHHKEKKRMIETRGRPIRPGFFTHGNLCMLPYIFCSHCVNNLVISWVIYKIYWDKKTVHSINKNIKTLKLIFKTTNNKTWIHKNQSQTKRNTTIQIKSGRGGERNKIQQDRWRTFLLKWCLRGNSKYDTDLRGTDCKTLIRQVRGMK